MSTLEIFKQYQTSIERVKVPALKQTAMNLAIFNAGVAKTMLDLKSAIEHRKIRFEELHVRTRRIKSYVKGHYGMNSKEYALIKGMQF